jgi:hypothetical protein
MQPIARIGLLLAVLQASTTGTESMNPYHFQSAVTLITHFDESVHPFEKAVQPESKVIFS